MGNKGNLGRTNMFARLVRVSTPTLRERENGEIMTELETTHQNEPKSRETGVIQKMEQKKET